MAGMFDRHLGVRASRIKLHSKGPGPCRHLLKRQAKELPTSSPTVAIGPSQQTKANEGASRLPTIGTAGRVHPRARRALDSIRASDVEVCLCPVVRYRLCMSTVQIDQSRRQIEQLVGGLSTGAI